MKTDQPEPTWPDVYRVMDTDIIVRIRDFMREMIAHDATHHGVGLCVICRDRNAKAAELLKELESK